MIDHRAEIFIHVARCLSISQAARDLYITQPSVTAAIQKLEEHYSVRLFHRNARGLELTAAGNLLYYHLRELKDKAVHLDNEMMDIKNEAHGRLLIGSSPTFGDYILPHLLGKFNEKYPGVTYKLHSGVNRQIYSRLQEGRIEVAFIVGSLPGKRIKAYKILEDEMVLILSPQHKYSKKKVITGEEIASLPLILREPGSGSRKDMEEALYSLGIDPAGLNIVAEFESPEAIKSAVESNLGVALMSRWAVAKEVQLDAISILNLDGVTIRRDIYVASLPEIQLTLTASRLIDMAVKLDSLISKPA
jgi:DNA-binding transcriptional LysR family regulator